MAKNRKGMNDRSDNSMKSSFFKKTSGLLATLMLLSAILPAMAFAAQGIYLGKDFTYQEETVNGSVYVSEDVYKSGIKVWIHIKDGDVWTAHEAVYDYFDTVTGNVYYKLDPSVKATSVTVDVYARYQTVSDNTYTRSVETRTLNHTTSNTGGGWIYIPPTNNGSISASDLTSAFAKGKVATFEISGNTATLPASALVNAPEGAVVVIKNATGSYELPVSVLDFAALAKELGVEIKDLSITVTIEALTGDNAKKFASDVEKIGGKAAGSAVNFEVAAVAGSKKVVVKDFGSTYVNRSINNVKASNNATGVLYNPATGEFSFIPATFSNNVATLRSTTNSIYAVVEFSNSFADVQGHWGKNYVEALANKLLVEGYEDGSFGPDRNITRAEFATIIVRALGLSSKTAAAANFTDVTANDWFANAVAIAAEAGIVKGYEDGSFQANKSITREELAAMVVRASAFAGTDVSVEASEVAAILAKFSDVDSIVWANAEVAAAVDAGIVEGYENSTFRGTNTATRAEAAAMVQRFLVNADLINK